MMMEGELLLETAGRWSLVLLLISVALSFVRLIRGPKGADRVVALDLIAVLVVAFLAAYAVYSGKTSFLDVAIAYALVAFLGTVALSRFLIRSCRRDSGSTAMRKKP